MRQPTPDLIETNGPWMLRAYGLTEATPEPATMEKVEPREAEEVAGVSQVKDT